ncbi:Smr/MutS family protein [Ectothiorhodospiraceae bacterium WFHF3C12]|nr:Smr/MutS family protein [Ectothiorhodospiraceae bacterium WFHF3C12]
MSADGDKSDLELFREAMQDVKPLRPKGEVLPPEAPKPAPLPRQRWADEASVMEELLQQNPELADTETGEDLSYLAPGMQRRVLRQLRRGHFAVGGELDLHGMTVPVAKTALAEFLNECHLRRVRCARVVHGKGRRSANRGPVLKGKVDLWLRQREDVLAFCSTPPTDGGTGAVYVLLSKS